MSYSRPTAVLGSIVVLALIAAPLASAGQSVVQAASPLAQQTTPEGATPGSTPVEFIVGLAPADQAGAEALAQSGLDPGQCLLPPLPDPGPMGEELSRRRPPRSRPSRAGCTEQKITVEGVSADRLSISASASAATVEHVFGTSLHQYRRHGKSLRLASTALTVPSSVAGLIAGISGVDQRLATPDHVREQQDRTRQEGQGRNPAARRLPQRAAMLELLRRKDRHDRSRIRRRLPGAGALRAMRLHARRSCRAPTA